MPKYTMSRRTIMKSYGSIINDRSRMLVNNKEENLDYSQRGIIHDAMRNGQHQPLPANGMYFQPEATVNKHISISRRGTARGRRAKVTSNHPRGKVNTFIQRGHHNRGGRRRNFKTNPIGIESYSLASNAPNELPKQVRVPNNIYQSEPMMTSSMKYCDPQMMGVTTNTESVENPQRQVAKNARVDSTPLSTSVPPNALARNQAHYDTHVTSSNDVDIFKEFFDDLPFFDAIQNAHDKDNQPQDQVVSPDLTLYSFSANSIGEQGTSNYCYQAGITDTTTSNKSIPCGNVLQKQISSQEMLLDIPPSDACAMGWIESSEHGSLTGTTDAQYNRQSYVQRKSASSQARSGAEAGVLPPKVESVLRNRSENLCKDVAIVDKSSDKKPDDSYCEIVLCQTMLDTNPQSTTASQTVSANNPNPEDNSWKLQTKAPNSDLCEVYLTTGAFEPSNFGTETSETKMLLQSPSHNAPQSATTDMDIFLSKSDNSNSFQIFSPAKSSLNIPSSDSCPKISNTVDLLHLNSPTTDDTAPFSKSSKPTTADPLWPNYSAKSPGSTPSHWYSPIWSNCSSEITTSTPCSQDEVMLEEFPITKSAVVSPQSSPAPDILVNNASPETTDTKTKHQLHTTKNGDKCTDASNILPLSKHSAVNQQLNPVERRESGKPECQKSNPSIQVKRQDSREPIEAEHQESSHASRLKKQNSIKSSDTSQSIQVETQETIRSIHAETGKPSLWAQTEKHQSTEATKEQSNKSILAEKQQLIEAKTQQLSQIEKYQFTQLPQIKDQQRSQPNQSEKQPNPQFTQEEETQSIQAEKQHPNQSIQTTKPRVDKQQSGESILGDKHQSSQSKQAEKETFSQTLPFQAENNHVSLNNNLTNGLISLSSNGLQQKKHEDISPMFSDSTIKPCPISAEVLQISEKNNVANPGIVNNHQGDHNTFHKAPEKVDTIELEHKNKTRSSSKAITGKKNNLTSWNPLRTKKITKGSKKPRKTDKVAGKAERIQSCCNCKMENNSKSCCLLLNHDDRHGESPIVNTLIRKMEVFETQVTLVIKQLAALKEQLTSAGQQFRTFCNKMSPKLHMPQLATQSTSQKEEAKSQKVSSDSAAHQYLQLCAAKDPIVINSGEGEIIPTDEENIIVNDKGSINSFDKDNIISSGKEDIISSGEEGNTPPDEGTITVTDEGGIIPFDEENIITSSKGDIISSGEADIIPSSKCDIITSAKGNIITSGRGDIISSGEGGIITSSEYDIITSGKRNIITSDRGDIISSMEGDIIPSSKCDIITSAKGNIITSGRGDIITSSEYDIITSGKRNIITSGKEDIITSGQEDIIPFGKVDIITSGEGDNIHSGESDIVIWGKGNIINFCNRDIITSGEEGIITTSGERDIITSGEGDTIPSGENDIITFRVNNRIAPTENDNYNESSVLKPCCEGDSQNLPVLERKSKEFSKSGNFLANTSAATTTNDVQRSQLTDSTDTELENLLQLQKKCEELEKSQNNLVNTCTALSSNPVQSSSLPDSTDKEIQIELLLQLGKEPERLDKPGNILSNASTAPSTDDVQIISLDDFPDTVLRNLLQVDHAISTELVEEVLQMEEEKQQNHNRILHSRQDNEHHTEIGGFSNVHVLSPFNHERGTLVPTGSIGKGMRNDYQNLPNKVQKSEADKATVKKLTKPNEHVNASLITQAKGRLTLKKVQGKENNAGKISNAQMWPDKAINQFKTIREEEQNKREKHLTILMARENRPTETPAQKPSRTCRGKVKKLKENIQLKRHDKTKPSPLLVKNNGRITIDFPISRKIKERLTERRNPKYEEYTSAEVIQVASASVEGNIESLLQRRNITVSRVQMTSNQKEARLSKRDGREIPKDKVEGLKTLQESCGHGEQAEQESAFGRNTVTKNVETVEHPLKIQENQTSSDRGKSSSKMQETIPAKKKKPIKGITKIRHKKAAINFKGRRLQSQKKKVSFNLIETRTNLGAGEIHLTQGKEGIVPLGAANRTCSKQLETKAENVNSRKECSMRKRGKREYTVKKLEASSGKKIILKSRRLPVNLRPIQRVVPSQIQKDIDKWLEALEELEKRHQAEKLLLQETRKRNTGKETRQRNTGQHKAKSSGVNGLSRTYNELTKKSARHVDPENQVEDCGRDAQTKNAYKEISHNNNMQHSDDVRTIFYVSESTAPDERRTNRAPKNTNESIERKKRNRRKPLKEAWTRTCKKRKVKSDANLSDTSADYLGKSNLYASDPIVTKPATPFGDFTTQVGLDRTATDVLTLKRVNLSCKKKQHNGHKDGREENNSHEYEEQSDDTGTHHGGGEVEKDDVFDNDDEEDEDYEEASDEYIDKDYDSESEGYANYSKEADDSKVAEKDDDRGNVHASGKNDVHNDDYDDDDDDRGNVHGSGKNDVHDDDYDDDDDDDNGIDNDLAIVKNESQEKLESTRKFKKRTKNCGKNGRRIKEAADLDTNTVQRSPNYVADTSSVHYETDKSHAQSKLSFNDPRKDNEQISGIKDFGHNPIPSEILAFENAIPLQVENNNNDGKQIDEVGVGDHVLATSDIPNCGYVIRMAVENNQLSAASISYGPTSSGIPFHGNAIDIPAVDEGANSSYYCDNPGHKNAERTEVQCSYKMDKNIQEQHKLGRRHDKTKEPEWHSKEPRYLYSSMPFKKRYIQSKKEDKTLEVIERPADAPNTKEHQDIKIRAKKQQSDELVTKEHPNTKTKAKEQQYNELLTNEQQNSKREAEKQQSNELLTKKQNTKRKAEEQHSNELLTKKQNTKRKAKKQRSGELATIEYQNTKTEAKKQQSDELFTKKQNTRRKAKEQQNDEQLTKEYLDTQKKAKEQQSDECLTKERRNNTRKTKDWQSNEQLTKEQQKNKRKAKEQRNDKLTIVEQQNTKNNAKEQQSDELLKKEQQTINRKGKEPQSDELLTKEYQNTKTKATEQPSDELITKKQQNNKRNTKEHRSDNLLIKEQQNTKRKAKGNQTDAKEKLSSNADVKTQHIHKEDAKDDNVIKNVPASFNSPFQKPQQIIDERKDESCKKTWSVYENQLESRRYNLRRRTEKINKERQLRPRRERRQYTEDVSLNPTRNKDNQLQPLIEGKRFTKTKERIYDHQLKGTYYNIRQRKECVNREEQKIQPRHRRGAAKKSDKTKKCKEGKAVSTSMGPTRDEVKEPQLQLEETKNKPHKKTKEIRDEHQLEGGHHSIRQQSEKVNEEKQERESLRIRDAQKKHRKTKTYNARKTVFTSLNPTRDEVAELNLTEEAVNKVRKAAEEKEDKQFEVKRILRMKIKDNKIYFPDQSGEYNTNLQSNAYENHPNEDNTAIDNVGENQLSNAENEISDYYKNPPKQNQTEDSDHIHTNGCSDNNLAGKKIGKNKDPPDHHESNPRERKTGKKIHENEVQPNHHKSNSNERETHDTQCSYQDNNFNGTAADEDEAQPNARSNNRRKRAIGENKKQSKNLRGKGTDEDKTQPNDHKNNCSKRGIDEDKKQAKTPSSKELRKDKAQPNYQKNYPRSSKVIKNKKQTDSQLNAFNEGGIDVKKTQHENKISKSEINGGEKQTNIQENGLGDGAINKGDEKYANDSEHDESTGYYDQSNECYDSQSNGFYGVNPAGYENNGQMYSNHPFTEYYRGHSQQNRVMPQKQFKVAPGASCALFEGHEGHENTLSSQDTHDEASNEQHHKNAPESSKTSNTQRNKRALNSRGNYDEASNVQCNESSSCYGETGEEKSLAGHPQNVCLSVSFTRDKKSNLEDSHNQRRPEKLLICNTCGKKYNSKRALISHENSHTNESYTCLICFKSFKRRQYLNQHKPIHFPRRRPYQCNQCHNAFFAQRTLDKHVLARHNKDKKKKQSNRKEIEGHRCETCGKILLCPASFIGHINLHKGLKTFECYHCEEKFATFAARFRHIKTYHPEKRIRKKGKQQ